MFGVELIGVGEAVHRRKDVLAEQADFVVDRRKREDDHRDAGHSERGGWTADILSGD
ncbi:hypothetical protein [Haloprofundus halobius]|uniref:hypothetical protein n=1 Tax=Haloprofundus halobius TaxID=2876194 RepID=UPI001CCFA5AB|nr:hypothetical protein [Haloprofundus halobius]